MAFQGYLTDADGTPVTGTVTLAFALYDVASGGTALWNETHANVAVSKGIYSVILGSQGSVLNLPFSKQYYIGVKVNADDEMSPRIAITAAPYALASKIRLHNSIMQNYVPQTSSKVLQSINGLTLTMDADAGTQLLILSSMILYLSQNNVYGQVAIVIDDTVVYKQVIANLNTSSLEMYHVTLNKIYTIETSGSHTIKIMFSLEQDSQNGSIYIWHKDANDLPELQVLELN
jgi:hypothetical protein